MWPQFLRLFANAFVVAYAVDAGLSTLRVLAEIVLGEVQSGESPHSALAALDSILLMSSLVVVCLAVIAIPLLGLTRKLAPLIFVPLVVSTLWFATGASPFLLIVPFTTLVRVLVAAQVGVAVAVFMHLRRLRGGTGWLFDSEWFSERLYSHRYLAVYGILASLTLILFVVVASVGGLLKGIDVMTNGFVRVDAQGISLAERVYELDVDPVANESGFQKSRRVRLVGMMHVGDEQAYHTLFRELGAASPLTIVLTEGVSDQEGALKEGFSYEALAEFLGVEEQGSIEQYIDWDRSKVGTAQAKGATLVNADLDISDFDPVTIDWLNDVGELYSGDSVVEDFLAIYRDMLASPERTQTINKDILFRRNQNLIAWIEASRINYHEIVVPWGALHLPGVEDAVLEMGFELRAGQHVPLLSWSQLNRAVFGGSGAPNEGVAVDGGDLNLN